MALTVVLIGIDGALAKSVYNALTASAFKLNVGQIKVITGSEQTKPLPQVEYIIGDVSNEEEALTVAPKGTCSGYSDCACNHQSKRI